MRVFIFALICFCTSSIFAQTAPVCSVTRTVDVNIQPCSNTNEQNSVLKAELVPNPANGQTTLQVAMKSVEKMTMICTDMQGRIVFKQQVELPVGASQLPIDVQNWPAGLYSISLQKENAKVLIQLPLSVKH